MLTEFAKVSKELQGAGFTLDIRHPDIKVARRLPTAVIRLSRTGRPVSAITLPTDTRCWTLRDGQHNSFPFVQIKDGLLQPRADHIGNAPRDPAVRRNWLLAAVDPIVLAPSFSEGWPTAGFRGRIMERQAELKGLADKPGAVMLDTIDRFLAATATQDDSVALLTGIAGLLIREVKQSADPSVLASVEQLLIGREGAFMFDAEGAESILDQSTIQAVSEVLPVRPRKGKPQDSNKTVRCGLTGAAVPVVTGPFPQPNLPQIGQTFIFARNSDIPANMRYGRSAAASMPVGIDTANEIAAAMTMITAEERRNKTWRPLPSEVPGATDLLIAFAEADLDTDIVTTLAGDDDERPNPQAVFELRARRVIDAIRAHVGTNFATSRLHLLIVRQLDPANRKVVYSSTPSVADLKAAAEEWVAGAIAIPSWLSLPIRKKKSRDIILAKPLVLAPLRLISMSRPIFVNGGDRSIEAPGLPAAEVLRVFLETGDARDPVLVQRILHHFLMRRGPLLIDVASTQLRPKRPSSGSDAALILNAEALRTVAILSVLLTKLERVENYMSEFPFTLGQFLAAADRVHAGYCADVRNGDVPPSLMGNQALAMAQATPIKALAVVESRLRPYKAWADRLTITDQRSKFDGWANGKDRELSWRGWAVLRALRNHRAMQKLATNLHEHPFSGAPDDAFRAELLLGYLSGIPPEPKDKTTDAVTTNNQSNGDE